MRLFTQLDLPLNPVGVGYDELGIGAIEILFSEFERIARLMRRPAGAVDHVTGGDVDGILPEDRGSVYRLFRRFLRCSKCCNAQRENQQAFCHEPFLPRRTYVSLQYGCQIARPSCRETKREQEWRSQW